MEKDENSYYEKIEALYKRAYKVINSLILYSKRFCDYLATPDGLIEYLQCLSRGKGEKASKSTYIYEFDYFVMTKSTKTLMAIRKLLDNNKSPMDEDIFILIRSLLENYIISQYVRTSVCLNDIEIEKRVISDFLINPYEIAMGYATKERKNGKHLIINDKEEILGKLITGPSSYVDEKERGYFRPLYAYLCKFSHCSFDVMHHYFESVNMSFSTEKVNSPFWTLICTLFVFTKLYENIVLEESEDLYNKKRCFNVLYDSWELQLEMIQEHIKLFQSGYRDIDREFLSLIIEKAPKDNYAQERINLALAMEADIIYGESSNVLKCYDKKLGLFERNCKYKEHHKG